MTKTTEVGSCVTPYCGNLELPMTTWGLTVTFHQKLVIHVSPITNHGSMVRSASDRPFGPGKSKATLGEGTFSTMSQMSHLRDGFNRRDWIFMSPFFVPFFLYRSNCQVVDVNLNGIFYMEEACCWTRFVAVLWLLWVIRGLLDFFVRSKNQRVGPELVCTMLMLKYHRVQPKEDEQWKCFHIVMGIEP